MHSICLLESVSRADGGIFEAEMALQRELHLVHGMEIDVVGLEDRHTAEDDARWLPLKPTAVPVSGPASLGYSPSLLPALDPGADLLYAATLWRYPSWAALRWAEQTGKPMIVAPHGSLDSWALGNAAWKKRIAAILFKNRQLHAANCLRALSVAEAESFRNYGLNNPICIVPNGVDLPEDEFTKLETRLNGCAATAGSANLKPEAEAKKTLLFLGRIHPKKGLPNLIRAFAEKLKDPEGRSNRDASWQLVIAGWDQGGHEAELMRLCKDLEIRGGHLEECAEGLPGEADVIFCGATFGKEKQRLFRSADAFVLPSLSEGLPMAVLEAWAFRLPVLMTPQCNLPEGFASGAAIRIGTDPESIAAGLGVLFNMNGEELSAMGDRGRELIRQRFTWKGVARQMKDVYGWLLGGGAPPACILFK